MGRRILIIVILLTCSVGWCEEGFIYVDIDISDTGITGISMEIREDD